MDKVKQFAEKNKDLLIIAANPASDEIVTFFNGYGTFVKFPKGHKIEDNVIFKMLFDSIHFREQANEFLLGLIKGIGTDETKANSFFQAVAGSVQGINGITGVKKKTLKSLRNNK